MALPERDPFRELLLTHIARYPRAEPRDVYKLLFQGYCGAEHVAADGDALSRLLAEIATLRETELEPMIEALPPEGEFVRVHLRPFLAAGGQVEALATAFTRWAQPIPGGRERLAAGWTRVVELAEAELFAFDAEAARRFGATQAAAGFPPARHSERYAENYFPAYRVLPAAAIGQLQLFGRS